MLDKLPVELLYEIQLYCLSSHIVHVCRRLNLVFNQAPPFFKAQFLLGRAVEFCPDQEIAAIYSVALRFPLCDLAVLRAIHGVLSKKKPRQEFWVRLPRRFFHSLERKSEWTAEDEPMPLLRFLYETPDIPTVNSDSNDGYALTRAVYAKFIPLVEFLLKHRASPKCRDMLAVKVAIRDKDLDMVKLLVERDTKVKKGKKRKVQDRVELDANLLRVAVEACAWDIVDYLRKEKNVVPDLNTLRRLK